MWVPESLGGSELDPLSSLRVIQTLAEADPSTAWVVMAASLATGTGGAYLADEAVAEMFGGARFPVVAGQGTRPGTAVIDGDGYRLSGSWSFASGIKHAQWIHTLGIVEDTGQPRIFVLPVEHAKLIDNWDVLGLRATGSIDYVIEDVYVPEGFTHFGPAEKGERGGSLYHLGIMHFALICHSGWALGVARRMLDELATLVQSKAGRPGTMADSKAFHTIYGEAEAKWHAARAFIDDTWRGVGETIAGGGTLSHEQRTMTRLALYHATWAAEEISVAVYRAAGTTALRSGSAALLPRHARRHPARDVGTGGDRELRKGPRRSGARARVAVHGPRPGRARAGAAAVPPGAGGPSNERRQPTRDQPPPSSISTLTVS